MSLYSAYVKPDQAVRVAEAIVDSMDPIDWRKVIEQILSQECEPGRRWSIRKIALTLGVSQPTVAFWRDGSVPNYESGRKLLAMAATIGGSRGAA